MNKYILSTIISTLAFAVDAQDQVFRSTPKLVVGITVDQLSTNDMERYAPLYGQDGFKKLIKKGIKYSSAGYSFYPKDQASAVASLYSGTVPYYHGIVGNEWLDRKTLHKINCTNDAKLLYAPKNLLVSNIADELKIATDKAALVYSVAPDHESAILAGGHIPNGVFWIDKNQKWTTSLYYPDPSIKWIENYNKSHTPANVETNMAVSDIAINCVKSNAMGRDKVTDLLAITLSAENNQPDNEHQTEYIYRQLDQVLARIITEIEQSVGAQDVLFFFSGTGYQKDKETDYNIYGIPSGTFYIDRTTNLLNVYLSAVYGTGRYIESCYKNQLFLNSRLIEQKHISYNEILSRSKDFLILNKGVKDVFTLTDLLRNNNDHIRKKRNGYNSETCGDILIEVAPGWKLLSESTGQNYIQRATFVPFPLVIYSQSLKPQEYNQAIAIESLAATICKILKIRAPNACNAPPLF